MAIDLKCIDLKSANRVVDRALELARAEKLKPLTVCILDTGGHFVCGQREDNSSLLRIAVAALEHCGLVADLS